MTAANQKSILLKINPRVVLLPIAALVAFGLYAQKRAAGFLNFYIQSVALAFDNLTPVLRLNIVVQNPSNEQFIVRSLTGQVYANDNPIGNVSSFVTVYVNPNSQVVLPVYVRLNVVSIVSDLLTLIQGGGGMSQTIKIKGNVNANSLVSPIDLSYKIL